eukprot:COSAG05_NODE_795_length_7281_cov_33.551100_5_plen_591_part_00
MYRPPTGLAGATEAAAAAQLRRLRSVLDGRVVGQDEVKRALLLGLISREHVYIEGPPGVAKTLLSETAAAATGSSVYAYQFHRDSRLDELVGDRVVVREPAGEGTEIIRQSTRMGGLLTAEMCVLDDISRAPGEALNVLLRLLNERRWVDGSAIPLVSAIATANPPRDDYFNEPLDPANLDRFTLQVQAEGLVHQRAWPDAARVVEQFGKAPHSPESEALHWDGAMHLSNATAEHPEPAVILRSVAGQISAETEAGTTAGAVASLSLLHGAHAAVALPPAIQRLIVLLLVELVSEHGCNVKNSLLTDRTFLVKAPRVMQAAALLDGRMECVAQDLNVLTMLTTFRVPPKVQAQMPEIITMIIKRAQEEKEAEEEAGGGQGGAGGIGEGGALGEPAEESLEQRQKRQAAEEEEKRKEEQRRKERDQQMQRALAEDGGGLMRNDGVEKKRGDAFSLAQKYPRLHEALKKLGGNIKNLQDAGKGPVYNVDRETIGNMEELLQVFGGKQQHANMEEVAHHGGQPRRWRQMVGLDSLEDCEPVETAIWCENVTPSLPRTIQRERVARGGALAIVRDISASTYIATDQLLRVESIF